MGGLTWEQCANTGGYTNYGQQSAADLAKFLGQQSADAGVGRLRYLEAVRTLERGDSSNRKATKIASREKTPPMIAKLIEAFRPNTDAPPGTGGTANRSNSSVDKLATPAKIFGRSLAGVSLILDIHEIVTSLRRT